MNVKTEIKMLMADPEVATSVVLSWIEYPGATTIDPVTGSKIGTVVRKTETIRGFFQEVSAISIERRFAEIQAGDAIIDIDPDVDLSSKEELELTIAGKVWVQKKVGSTLQSIWDANCGDYPTLKTYALTRKT